MAPQKAIAAKGKQGVEGSKEASGSNVKGEGRAKWKERAVEEQERGARVISFSCMMLPLLYYGPSCL